jgi:secreted PhoX family phosphatase
VVSTGIAYELEELGKWSWENSVTSPYPQKYSIVMGPDDSTVNGQVYVWVGNKQSSGTEIEMAGLVNYTSGAGGLFAVKVDSGPQGEQLATPFSGRFSLIAQGDQTGVSGATLDAFSVSSGATAFLRPEDGHWDLNNPNDFYFVTTSAVGGSSRLYRLRFDNVKNPLAGGSIEALIDGAGSATNTGFGTGEMFDNMTVDNMGRAILQEDVGNNALLGKIWAHDIASGATLELARHDSARFLSTGASYIGTQDEEASGIIDVSDILGAGKYLMVDQVHKPNTDTELVEYGQLQLLT